MGQRKTTRHLKKFVLLYSIYVLGKIAKKQLITVGVFFCSVVNSYILTDRGSKRCAQLSHLLVVFFCIVVVFSSFSEPQYCQD